MACPMANSSALQFRDRLIAAAAGPLPPCSGGQVPAGCVGRMAASCRAWTRHRPYIPVVDASLMLEAGKALEALLWPRCGGLVRWRRRPLPRCLVDGSVCSPEWLDFAGPSALADG